jgi:hypothetical protein
MTHNTQTIASNLEALSAEELNSLAALVADQIAARQMKAAIVADVLTPAASVKAQRKSTKRNSGEWEEIKIISGHAYRYRRYWQDGKLRSKYIGKA